MGRVRRLANHLLGGDSSSTGSTTANLVRSTLTQPVLHCPIPERLPEPSIRRTECKTPQTNILTPDTPSPQSRLHASADEPPTRDPSIWARAFQHFRESRPELAAYYAEHLESLGDNNPDEDVSSPTTLQTVDRIVQQLHHHREKRQWKIPLAGKDIKIREQAEKFAKFLLWSDPIVKDALSAQPYAALAWSGVSLLLSLLTAGTSQHAAMLHGFNTVNDTLVYWHICEETYLEAPHRLEHRDLVAAVANLYSLMIEYQARAICHLSRRQLFRAWEKVTGGNEWTERIQQIEVENERCRRMIDPLRERQIQKKVDNELRVMQESQVILDNIRQALEETKSQSQSHYEDQLERALLHDLASDYEGYKNFNPLRVDGTCEWLFKDAAFRKWRDNSTPGLLWVSAGPGCGKSVLSRALIDEGRLSTRVTTSTVCHFFFKKGDQRRMSAASALSAITHQLFAQNPDRSLMSEALRRHRSYGNALGTNMSELWQILAHYAGSPNAGEVICVLDALDECDERDREILLEQIKNFYCLGKTGDRPCKLKFFVTSRPHDGLEQVLRKFSNVGALVHIDGDDMSREIGQEINLVIDAKLSNITASFADRDRERIYDKLKSMRHRTYLWLHLTLDIIEKSPSKFGRARDLEDFLSKLPSQVSEAYERILSRSTDRRQTETLLGIVVAAQRPLTLDEANIALTLALDNTMPTSLDGLAPWPRDCFKAVVQNLCGLFISVSDSKLSLIHQTARDFLLNPTPGGAWQGCLSLLGVHSTMSRACLYYLRLLSDHTSASALAYSGQQYHSLQESHPFLSYAATYWPTHYLAACPNSDTDRHALALCQRTHAHIWVPEHLSRGNFLRWWTWNDLAFASYFGLAPVVNDILSQDEGDMDIDTPCSDYGTALQTAAAGGYEIVVRVLVERGRADINADANRGQYGTALRIAAARGQAGVVQLLLRQGADPDIRGITHGTALEAAEAGGHKEVSKILRTAGAGTRNTRSPVAEHEPRKNEGDEKEMLLLPWLDDGASKMEMPEWDAAHMPWMDDRDVKVLPSRPQDIEVMRPRQAKPLIYMAEMDDSSGFEAVGVKGVKSDRNMPFLWLGT